ncbi:DUF4148 domain-containing protein [Bordetella genomosp. 13]|uniref:DUF4148 domain-containing protein n=1 Tax=Bordetella genomosp. 13 TaxID=463040 RepID=UPI0011A27E59|nr:DUF4148 domain-containing protein [Bordetella genomosp. 13]
MMKARILKKIVPAMLLSLLAAGAAQAQEATVVPPSQSTLSRADVVRDLRAWQQAGLEQEWQSDDTPDVYSTAYRAKYAEYLRLTQANRQAQAPSQSQPDAHG